MVILAIGKVICVNREIDNDKDTFFIRVFFLKTVTLYTI